MTITGSELLGDLKDLLSDPSEDIWDEDLKIDAVNEALRLIALFRPDAFAVTEDFEVSADTPKQAIPSTGLRFLDVIMNSDGAPVTKIDKKVLSESVPGWTTETGSAIQHYMFDEENPKIFWVYPVPTTSFNIILVYSDTPATFLAASTSLGVSDIYISPVKNFVLHRCFGMETQGSDFGKASTYLNSFYTALGVKTQSDAILKQVQES